MTLEQPSKREGKKEQPLSEREERFVQLRSEFGRYIPEIGRLSRENTFTLREIGNEAGVLPQRIPGSFDGEEDEKRFLHEAKEVFDLKEVSDDGNLVAIRVLLHRYADIGKRLEAKRSEVSDLVDAMGREGYFRSKGKEIVAESGEEVLSGMMNRVEGLFSEAKVKRRENDAVGARLAENEAIGLMDEITVRIELLRALERYRERDLKICLGVARGLRDEFETEERKTSGGVVPVEDPKKQGLLRYLAEQEAKMTELGDRIGSARRSGNETAFGNLMAQLRKLGQETETNARRWYPDLLPQKADTGGDTSGAFGIPIRDIPAPGERKRRVSPDLEDPAGGSEESDAAVTKEQIDQLKKYFRGE